MCEFEPGRAPHPLAPYEVSINQGPDGTVIKRPARVRPQQDLTPNPVFGDQLTVEPLPDQPLFHPGLCGDSLYLVGIVTSKGVIHVAQVLYGLFVDRLIGLAGLLLP